jgi:TnpA family transposase
VRNALEAGDLYVADSTEFRRFEDDLIGDDRWQDKEGVLHEVGAPILTAPIEETLASFRKDLDAKFESVNQNIASGRNKDIKITGADETRRWTLACPATEEPTDSPFYSRLPGIGIADLLWFVAGRTGFMDSFTHVLDRYVKYEADARSILACIVAMGTNMGLWKMAEVSSLSHQSLVSTARNYLRTETLHAANDTIGNAIATLPMFRQYDIQDDLHSSSDGQRIETQIETINARHPKHYADCLIKPSRKVLDSLICSEWPNIQRIMASLAQKDVTQATVVRKLSSYARQNRTKKALAELDNICRTLYILNYIDDVVLRQSVRKALNRGEAYHRFRRAIAYVNSSKFRVKTESEQQIWNECSRLIANAVIYYNTALLSQIYTQKKVADDVAVIDILKRISPVAWQHINLFGRFEFTKTGAGVDLDALAERYNNPDFWSRVLREGGLDG